MSDFLARAPNVQRVCKQSVRPSGSEERDAALRRETLDVVDNGCWCGPHDQAALAEEVPLWISAEPFGIRQKNKVRVMTGTVFVQTDATSMAR